MKLKSIIAITALITSNAMAEDSHWKEDKYGFFVESSQDNTYAVIEQSQDGRNFVYINMYGYDECEGKKQGYTLSDIRTNINGNPAKLSGVCIGASIASYRPHTVQGMNFMINEFKTKTKVVIGKVRFSAVGFSRLWNIENRML